MVNAVARNGSRPFGARDLADLDNDIVNDIGVPKYQVLREAG